ncbi:hypothetical protein HJB53_28015 [Rhizobium lentis]|nr:hypothetical protein [Rhizobium lentis]MBX5130338.1 hypothetical protein [Rhizobium lentis]
MASPQVAAIWQALCVETVKASAKDSLDTAAAIDRVVCPALNRARARSRRSSE